MRKFYLLLLAIFIFGCSETPPDKVVTEYFNALKKADFKKADSYLAAPQHQNTPEDEKLFMTIYSKNSSVSDLETVEITDTSAVISGNVSIIDMQAAYTSYENEVNDHMTRDPKYMPDLNDNTLFLKHVEINSDKKIVQKTYFYLEKFDKKWKLTYFETEPTYELLGTETAKMIFLESEDSTSLCFFKSENTYFYMYCTNEQAAALDGKNDIELNTTYRIYKDWETNGLVYELVTAE